MQNETLNKENINSNLTLNNRNKFIVTGVTRAVSANQTNICLVVGKTNMYITGTMLHISKLDITTGVCEGDGWVDTIKYGKSSGIIRKIFK